MATNFPQCKEDLKLLAGITKTLEDNRFKVQPRDLLSAINTMAEGKRLKKAPSYRVLTTRAKFFLRRDKSPEAQELLKKLR